MSNTDKPAESTRTVGRGMIIAAWIILLLLLTVFFNDRLDLPLIDLAHSIPRSSISIGTPATDRDEPNPSQRQRRDFAV